MTTQEFAYFLTAIRDLRQSGFAQGAALATLVQTKGSSFRRAGARMLVFADGRIVRGLSAGCPEADLAVHARQVIEENQARIVRYDREHGYDALLELGCGGEIEALIEPLRADADVCFMDAIAHCLESRSDGVMALVYARDGKCLPRPQRLIGCGELILDEVNQPHSTQSILPQLTAVGAATRAVQIQTQSGLLSVLIERIVAAQRLVVVGMGATASALTRLATGLGWQVVLVDHRDDLPRDASPKGASRIVAGPDHLLQKISFDSRTAVVVMTHNLERDLAYLRVLREQPMNYLGVLGSRRRAVKVAEALGDGAEKIYSPAGLDIGSETPEEIALAIAAEIQAVVSGHRGGSLRAMDGPIH